MSLQAVCRLADIGDPEARGFPIETPQGPMPAFVVRRGGDVYAYLNICPHAGNALNWKPDAFLTRDRQRIMCAVHGANFEIDTGLCIEGPCPGRSLWPLPARIEEGWIKVGPPADR